MRESGLREGSVVRGMAGSRKCTFVPDRDCDFESDQLSMDFCRVCMEAWKASGAEGIGLRIRRPQPNSIQEQEQDGGHRGAPGGPSRTKVYQAA